MNRRVRGGRAGALPRALHLPLQRGAAPGPLESSQLCHPLLSAPAFTEASHSRLSLLSLVVAAHGRHWECRPAPLSSLDPPLSHTCPHMGAPVLCFVSPRPGTFQNPSHIHSPKISLQGLSALCPTSLWDQPLSHAPAPSAAAASWQPPHRPALCSDSLGTFFTTAVPLLYSQALHWGTQGPSCLVPASLS